MKCSLTHIAAGVHVCARADCWRTVRVEAAKPKIKCRGHDKPAAIPDHIRARAEAIAAVPIGSPQGGVGVEFRKMAAEYDVEQKGCGCAATESRMNRLGPDGCRREIESLVDEVMANARKMARPMTRGLARHAIEEAIRRAEAAIRPSSDS